MMTGIEDVALSEDLVIGAEAVARFLGMTKRQVYSCVERKHMPLFKIGAQVCARRSVVLAWIKAQELASLQQTGGQP